MGVRRSVNGWLRWQAQLGAEVRLNEEVTRLHFEGRRAVGLETAGGQRHNFDALVINADFSAAMQRLVPDSLRRALVESASGSQSVFLFHVDDVSGDGGQFSGFASSYDLHLEGL